MDTEQTPLGKSERQEVYCTKVGTTHPEEMYIVGGHMDGIGWGQAANDDGSGTALVMELARVFSNPDVKTDRSIRFVLWNNEESGLNGAHAYVDQRQALQGKEEPAGSGKYPEPKWLGMIQHDMMMFDHGMPRADGTLSPEQRPEADVNIEFAGASKFAEEAMKLAWFFQTSNEKYATDYPARVGQHMTNTDSDPFKDLIPAISLRENERGEQIGAGWDPNWHQPTDMYTTYSDKDFRLGLNAAQTTLSAIAQLTGATIKKKSSDVKGLDCNCSRPITRTMLRHHAFARILHVHVEPREPPRPLIEIRLRTSRRCDPRTGTCTAPPACRVPAARGTCGWS